MDSLGAAPKGLKKRAKSNAFTWTDKTDCPNLYFFCL